ncbi:MAG: TatD family hydrolase [Thaumarchaeota archaeon]|nr:TatD family hydrolase [Nitrososphaerota archaeon]
MTWLFDSHIHLSDFAYHEDLNYIIKGMENMKIKACCVSMDFLNSKKTLEISKQSKLILPFIGIHPERANDDLDKMINLIQENIHIISGIGEIGLDPTYIQSDEDKKNQFRVFESLLSIAEKYQKPISIHSRKSIDEIFEIMTSYKTKHALLHWFDGSKKQLRKAMDKDFFVSYGPVMIYANDKQTLLTKTDEEKILVETDGPVRFSKCFEMKSAQIGFIPSVIFCSSKILGKQYDEMTSILERNSKNFLGI